LQDLTRDDALLQDRDGKTALVHTFSGTPCEGSVRVATRLLQVAPELANVCTFQSGKPAGWTALHCLGNLPKTDATVQYGVAMARLFLEACSPEAVNTRSNKKSTALHFMCQHGHTAMVDLLVRDGRCRFDMADQTGRAPLDTALRHSQEVAEILEAAGAPCLLARPRKRTGGLWTGRDRSNPLHRQYSPGAPSKGSGGKGSAALYYVRITYELVGMI